MEEQLKNLTYKVNAIGLMVALFWYGLYGIFFR
jgi:hypothetical protein